MTERMESLLRELREALLAEFLPQYDMDPNSTLGHPARRLYGATGDYIRATFDDEGVRRLGAHVR